MISKGIQYNVKQTLTKTFFHLKYTNRPKEVLNAPLILLALVSLDTSPTRV